MVQWLKPCAPNAGGTGSIFGLGIKIPHSLQCDQKERKKRSISSKLGVYQRTVTHWQARRPLSKRWCVKPATRRKKLVLLQKAGREEILQAQGMHLQQQQQKKTHQTCKKLSESWGRRGAELLQGKADTPELVGLSERFGCSLENREAF